MKTVYQPRENYFLQMLCWLKKIPTNPCKFWCKSFEASEAGYQDGSAHTLLHCHTVTHCHSVTLSDCQNVTLSDCQTVTLSHCQTLGTVEDEASEETVITGRSWELITSCRVVGRTVISRWCLLWS